jgi:pimeloyl-ACP methyl ester carboxylesterase
MDCDQSTGSGIMKQAIIIIGGYNSVWAAYLKMARELEDLSGLRTIGVPLMPWDWWLAGRREDATNILRKLAETVEWARSKFRADRFILVGHSAGGVAARLYLCDQPAWGHTYSGLELVTSVITLGSPHCDDRESDTGWFFTDKANRLVPGTPYSGRVHYRTVAGRFLQGREEGSYRERRAFRTYSFFDGQGDTWGDGMVPVQSARLDGAESLVLKGVAHSRKVSRHWYGGSRAIIHRWWSAESGHAG